MSRTIFGTALAVAIAVMRLSPSKIVSGTAAAYAFFFRGIPLIVLLILIGNLGLFFKNFTIAIPFTDITFWSRPVREVMNPFRASVLGLSLAGSGYMSEIVRGGLLAVGRGQGTRPPKRSDSRRARRSGTSCSRRRSG